MTIFSRRPIGSDALAPDCRGSDFFALDADFRALLKLYLEPKLRGHLWPHFRHLSRLAGGRLDGLAATAGKHPPVLYPRDRFGRDRERIEYHPPAPVNDAPAWSDDLE
ncbi:MAG: hypothetical protein GKR94_34655 [Gammaproteobacteria bacterium]|nr:hypothetical protein [Gammaproteobacteria bacterium]